MHHETSLLSDPIVWYTLALLVFLGAALRWGKAPILSWLDGEISKVRTELDRARQLRVEAEAVLADYRTKQQAALSEAQAIVTQAKKQAEQLRIQAEADLKSSLARHEQQSLDRIKQAETDAMADVRRAIIDTAMATARTALAEKLDAQTASRLIDQAIAEIPTDPAVKNKAEAA